MSPGETKLTFATITRDIKHRGDSPRGQFHCNAFSVPAGGNGAGPEAGGRPIMRMPGPCAKDLTTCRTCQ